jgi:hypothetical protein
MTALTVEPRGRSRSGWIAQRRDVVVDVVGAGGLTMLAVVGFRTSFGGYNYVLCGALGIVLGIVSVLGGRALRWPWWQVAVLGLAVFLVLGSVPLPEESIARVVPTMDVVRGVVHGLTAGWKELLTAAPPVGSTSPLLVIPYACGFLSAALSLVLARTRLSALPAAPPAAVMFTTILLGTPQPAAKVVHGTIGALGALVWASHRASRRRRVIASGSRRTRSVSAVALVGIAVGGSLILGPAAFRGSTQRYTWRADAQPPLDPQSFVSPLAIFRSFLADHGKDTATSRVVLRVDGLPKGAPVKLASLDSYDGVVWRSGGPDQPSSGRYVRVGPDIASPSQGRRFAATFTVEDLATPWLPTAGVVDGIQYAGPRANELRESARFNGVADTALVPVGLNRGDRYRIEAALPPAWSKDDLAKAALDSKIQLPEPPGLPSQYKTKAGDMIHGAPSPYLQAKDGLEATFRQGFYSDGGPGTGVPSGHSIGRMNDFLLGAGELTGDGEQYAAAMGLLARSLGLPARVAVGFLPPERKDGTTRGDWPRSGGAAVVHSADIAAWVEVAFDGYGWVSFYPTPSKDRVPHPRDKPHPKKVREEVQAPPPPPDYVAPDSAGSVAKHRRTSRPVDIDETGGLPGFVTWGAASLLIPTALVGGTYLLVTGLKRRRRQRRRTMGRPADRIVGGWNELCDQALDLGVAVSDGATRLEQAGELEVLAPPARTIALAADRATFGFDEPTDADVDAFWTFVEAEMASMVDPLPRGQRVRVALRLDSLLRRKERP